MKRLTRAAFSFLAMDECFSKSDRFEYNFFSSSNGEIKLHPNHYTQDFLLRVRLH